MMDSFTFKWKRRGLWHKREVVGFKPEGDRMALFSEDGSIFEIPKWSECHCSLGADFFMWKKRKMEREAGQKIPVANE